MYKELKWDDDEVESEDDLYEVNLTTGSQVDFILNKETFKWTPWKVVWNLGKILKIQNDNDKMDVDGESNSSVSFWVPKDSSDLAPFNSKSTSLKAKVNSLYLKACY